MLETNKLPGGAMIYYYFVCPRKLWFYVHKLTMEHESDFVQIGKYIELFYKEDKKYEKNIVIDNIISPDALKRNKDYILVFEIKKSEKFKDAALWQLKYYLWYLKNKGLNVKGKLVIPEYNKEEYIELTEKDEEKIKEILRKINDIIRLDKPPRVVKKDYCNACAYYPLCWDEY
jgi:CRISPR-associated exonuclease Cas4